MGRTYVVAVVGNPNCGKCHEDYWGDASVVRGSIDQLSSSIGCR